MNSKYFTTFHSWHFFMYHNFYFNRIISHWQFWKGIYFFAANISELNLCRRYLWISAARGFERLGVLLSSSAGVLQIKKNGKVWKNLKFSFVNTTLLSLDLKATLSIQRHKTIYQEQHQQDTLPVTVKTWPKKDLQVSHKYPQVSQRTLGGAQKIRREVLLSASHRIAPSRARTLIAG